MREKAETGKSGIVKVCFYSIESCSLEILLWDKNVENDKLYSDRSLEAICIIERQIVFRGFFDQRIALVGETMNLQNLVKKNSCF